MTTEADYEPTLYDVMTLLIGMDKRLFSLAGQANSIEIRMDTGFRVLNERIDLMDSRVVSMEKTIHGLVLTVADLEDEHVSLDRSRGMHNSTLKDYGRRIRKLEKT